MANDESSAAAFGALPDELQAAALAEQAVHAAAVAAAAAAQQQQQQQQQVLAAAAAAAAAAVVAGGQPVPPDVTLLEQQAVVSPSQPSFVPPKKRKGGRQKDPVWQNTTLVDGKEVVCNKCHTVIHRYGCTKVERVRAHFENKCVFTKRPKLQHDEGDSSGDAVGLVDAKSARYRSEYANKMGMLKRRIAQWIFASGHSFSEIRNSYLRNAFKTLRPDIMFPTQYELENDLLDLEFNASLAKVNRAISGKACCLVLENWVDSNGQGMTNFIAYAEGVHHFLEAAPAAEPEKEISGDEIERVLMRQKKAIVYGVLAPLGDMVSKASREKIQKKFLQCVFYYGCLAYALRLLMTDMCAILPWLGEIHDSVQLLLKALRQNPRLHNILRALQHAEGKAPLVFLDDALGSTICDTLDSILKSERELVALVSRRDFMELALSPDELETFKKVQNFVLGDAFLQDLLNALNILHPLQQQLARVQSDRVPVSYVYHCFVELMEFYGQMEVVNKKDKALITSCVNDRFQSIYGDCHGVAYMLDPVFLGASMDEAKKHEVETFIVNCCTHILQAVGVDILDQLSKYRDMVQQLKECNQPYWDLLVTGKVRPFDFWVERRQFPQLQQLAWVVFALPVSCTVPTQELTASSTALQAKFSQQLPVDKFHKLLHVYNNAKFQQQQLDAKEPEPLLTMMLNDTDDPTNALV
ncbi:hypothetical protein P43SY_001051 [Pythium insidiosum]|uniref:BED-type domain-containing protein n=1 Tax=Pythium insidiosum TaxID=114742 RepID=A0AAD5Q6Q2_PYTIN|nr:hypothetical protein P43SY_001051 [Pythium insidiosum]